MAEPSVNVNEQGFTPPEGQMKMGIGGKFLERRDQKRRAQFSRSQAEAIQLNRPVSIPANKPTDAEENIQSQQQQEQEEQAPHPRQSRLSRFIRSQAKGQKQSQKKQKPQSASTGGDPLDKATSQMGSLVKIAMYQTGAATYYIHTLIYMNFQMVLGYYLFKKQSKMLPALTWEEFVSGCFPKMKFKIFRIFPDSILHILLLFVDILVTAIVLAIVCLSAFIITIWIQAIADPLGAAAGLFSDGGGFGLSSDIIQLLSSFIGL